MPRLPRSFPHLSAWFRGWLFFIVVVAASILITLYLRRVNPDVIAARVTAMKGQRAGIGGCWAF